MASHAAQLTRTFAALLLAATGVIVAAPGAAAAPKPRSRIAFEAASDQGQQVVVSSPYGTRQRRLTSGPNSAEQPRWSPLGTRILYLRRTPEDQFDLMVMGARGRHKHQLLSGRGRFIIDMAWGPGGGRIALAMSRDTDKGSDVFIYSLRTRKLTRLHARSDPDRDVTSVDWSPDGRTIAFSAVDYTEDGNDLEDNDLYLIRPNGHGLRRLTHTITRDEWRPSWSPDGRHLAYALGSPVCAGAVMIASADGSNPRRLRAGCSLTSARAAWSPNGRRLLVERYDRRGIEMIWSMALNGADRRFVTHGRNADWRPR